jgi:phosphatidate cytidylyltransferase
MLLVLPLTMVFQSLSVPREDPGGALIATLAPVLYIAPAAGLAVILRDSPHGVGLVFITLVGVWVNDTGAYFAGRAFGRHKLAPRLSPNKSIEGFVGGVIACIVVTWYAHFLTGDTEAERWLTGVDALVIGTAIAFATPFGDLFESMLKRAMGVKDSSNLLREHGGMLDRIDSLLIAIPVAYLASFLVGVQ